VCACTSCAVSYVECGCVLCGVKMCLSVSRDRLSVADKYGRQAVSPSHLRQISTCKDVLVQNPAVEKYITLCQRASFRLGAIREFATIRDRERKRPTAHR